MVKKLAVIKTTTIDYVTFTDIDFKPPATYWVRCSTGDYIFFHTNDRALAQTTCNDMFGVGKYTVNAARTKKQTKELTCRGTATRNK